MSDLLTHIRRFELVDVDLDKEPQCEGRLHGTGVNGHDDGPAKYRVTLPCGCPPKSILACSGRVICFRRYGATCELCGGVTLPDDLLIFEL